MKKMILCAVHGLTGLIICFSCAAQQTAVSNANSPATGTESKQTIVSLIDDIDDEFILELINEPDECLKARIAIINAVKKLKTNNQNQEEATLSPQDKCAQVRSTASTASQNLSGSSSFHTTSGEATYPYKCGKTDGGTWINSILENKGEEKHWREQIIAQYNVYKNHDLQDGKDYRNGFNDGVSEGFFVNTNSVTME